MAWKSSRSSWEMGSPERGSHSSAGSCQTAIFTPEETRSSTTLGSACLATAISHCGHRKLYEPLWSLAHTRTDTSPTVRSTSPQLGQLARIVVTTFLLHALACDFNHLIGHRCPRLERWPQLRIGARTADIWIVAQEQTEHLQ